MKRLLTIVLSIAFLSCLTVGCANQYKVYKTRPLPMEYQQSSPETK